MTRILFVLLCLFCITYAKTRTYFLQAEEHEWNFAPGLKNLTSTQKFYYERTSSSIGSVYTKCLYRRYTDETFKVRHGEDDRSPGSKWEHLGFLGPVLRAVVGDLVVVHFKNTCNIPASIHCHGVRYLKNGEGASYDGMVFPGDIVKPGSTYTYYWEILTRSGPAPEDPSNIGWPYHSHVNEVADTNSGLIGTILIGRNEEICPDGYPVGHTREFVTLFMIMDENKSHYLKQNIHQKLGITKEKEVQALQQSSDFVDSNLKHTVNGRGFFTLRGLVMTTKDKVRWYVVGMGTEMDIHTAHWHAHTVVRSSMRKDVLEVFPATVQIGDMEPDTPGKWMYHCHVGDHITAGMMNYYEVKGQIKNEFFQ